MQKKIFLVDFDGTITINDLAEQILRKFASDKWLYYDSLFLQGKLSLEDTIINQYSLIDTPKNLILEYVDKTVSTRKNFSSFIDFCQKNNIPVVIISAGIDFTITHVLDRLGVLDKIQLVSVKTEYKENGFLQVTKPKRYDLTVEDFKQDHVLYYKSQNYLVYHIGDGDSDYKAAESADFVFAVKNSTLSSKCQKGKFNYQEFSDFQEILEKI